MKTRMREPLLCGELSDKFMSGPRLVLMCAGCYDRRKKTLRGAHSRRVCELEIAERDADGWVTMPMRTWLQVL
jgi:hypothetical protein